MKIWLVSFYFPNKILTGPSKQFLPLSFIIQLLETIPHEKLTGPNHPLSQKRCKEKIKKYPQNNLFECLLYFLRQEIFIYFIYFNLVWFRKYCGKRISQIFIDYLYLLLSFFFILWCCHRSRVPDNVWCFSLQLGELNAHAFVWNRH